MSLVAPETVVAGMSCWLPAIVMIAGYAGALAPPFAPGMRWPGVAAVGVDFACASAFALFARRLRYRPLGWTNPVALTPLTILCFCPGHASPVASLALCPRAFEVLGGSRP